MRAYWLRMTKDDGTVLKQYVSQNPDGSNNGAALKVEFDIPAYAYGTPAANAHIKVSGVNYADIQQSSNLATANTDASGPRGANVEFWGGMAKGLPLANPAQYGLLLKGQVVQCWGNWQGRETSLEIIVAYKPGTQAQPVNLAWNWLQGTTLQTAITQTLQTAYPGAVITGTLSDSLVYTETQPGNYQTLDQFARYVIDTSHAIIPSTTYVGAQITQTPAGFYLYDGTKDPAAKAISYYDLIGAPTWLDVLNIQFKCVLRADLKVGDIVTMPAGTNAVNAENNFSQYRNKNPFQGTFRVNNIRHLGDSRQATADAWVTVIDASSNVGTTS